MKLSKEDKELLREQHAMVWKGKKAQEMVDYNVGKASGIIELGEFIVTYDKPSIETDFWFPEHTYDYDEVVEEANACSKSEQYFIGVNLQRFDDLVERLDDTGNRWFVGEEYWQQPADCKLGSIECIRRSWNEQEVRLKRARELTKEEVADYRKFIIEEREKFDKRLRAYLKRYGLTKCHYSVYWADR